MCEDGDLYFYDTLVLATGARARRPNLPGVHKQNIYTFRTLKDAEEILAGYESAKNIVVDAIDGAVGGGQLIRNEELGINIYTPQKPVTY